MDFTALEHALSALGLRDLSRILGGWQSLAVYRARVDGRPVVVKVLDPQHVEREVLDVRVDALSRLATTTDLVCAPVPVGDQVVMELAPEPDAPVYAVAYEFAEGEAPDITDPEDVAQMGRTLAALHGSMAALPPLDLPPLALSEGPGQLLHGDLSSKNMRGTGRRWRVFDFDDCGYGPVELDLALSLYFVLFDALTGAGRDAERYRQFRRHFIRGYEDGAGAVPADDVLDGLITRRVLALASWLAEPDSAPPGIRAASAEWHATLQGFVESFLAARGGPAGQVSARPRA